MSRKGPACPSAFRLYERDESDGAIVRGVLSSLAGLGALLAVLKKRLPAQCHGSFI